MMISRFLTFYLLKYVAKYFSNSNCFVILRFLFCCLNFSSNSLQLLILFRIILIPYMCHLVIIPNLFSDEYVYNGFSNLGHRTSNFFKVDSTGQYNSSLPIFSYILSSPVPISDSFVLMFSSHSLIVMHQNAIFVCL